MKRKLISLLTAVSVIAPAFTGAYTVRAESDLLSVCAYYNENGTLIGVKNLTGDLNEGEIKTLASVLKPDGADFARVFSWDEQRGKVISTGSYAVNISHDITIIGTNDMHGCMEGTDTVIGIDKIAELKKLTQNSLLFDAGDATQGVSYAALTQGADVIMTMNAAGYDGMALGNHEFDYGFDTLLQNISMANFACLGANVAVPEREDGKSIDILPNRIYEVNGHKIGVFGLTTKSTEVSVSPYGLQGVTFTDEVEAAKEQVKYLKDMGAEVIIALTHMGTNDTKAVCTSLQLAGAMEGSGLNLIVDGHSHTLVNTVRGGIPIIQAETANSHVGEAVIDINDDGSVEVDTCILSADFFKNIPSDEATQSIVRSTVGEQSSLTAEVVSCSNSVLWGGFINGVTEAWLFETNLGDFVTDVMLKKAQTDIGDVYTGVPFAAAINGGAIRDTIYTGDTTWGDIIDVFPFSNSIAYKLITPKTLYDMLEVSVSGISSQDKETGMLRTLPKGGFLQIAGFTYEIYPDSSDSKVGNVYLDGSDVPLDRNDEQTQIVLVTNDYVAGGADGYDMLSGIEQIGGGGGLAEAFTAALREYGPENPLTYPVTKNRIRIVSDYDKKEYTANVYVQNRDRVIRANEEITYTVDGVEKTGKTDEMGMLQITVPNGAHTVECGKNAVYINNYSGAGVYEYSGDYTITYPTLIAE